MLSLIGVPVHADSDPIWYLDCTPATPTLVQTNPTSMAVCAQTTTLSASGPSGTSFAVGSVSDMQIAISGRIGTAGTYTLMDTTASTTVASGTFSGGGTVAGRVIRD